MPQTTQRHQPVARTHGPDFPVTARDPRGPVVTTQASGRPLRRPLYLERAEDGSAPVVVLPNLHNLHNLPTLPRASAGDQHTVERHLRHPATTEGPAPPRWTPCQLDDLTRPLGSQDQTRAPGGGPQHRHSQCVIIARQPTPSNVDAALAEPEPQFGEVTEHAVPRAALLRRGAAGACHIVERARAQSR